MKTISFLGGLEEQLWRICQQLPNTVSGGPLGVVLKFWAQACKKLRAQKEGI
jgi:hypothetical protein